MLKYLFVLCAITTVLSQESGRRAPPPENPAPVTEPYLEVSSVKCDVDTNNFCGSVTPSGTFEGAVQRYRHKNG